MILVGSLLTADPASAAPAPNCVKSGATVTCTVTYSFTGDEQEFTVPSGITSLRASAVGGSGGVHIGVSSSGAPGGRGAAVSGSFAVTPGQTLFVEVGGNGSDWVPANSAPGGFNGGGSAPSYFLGTIFDLGGAGGGGASDIRTKPEADPASLSSRLLVAGGGGGSSIDGGGGDAGNDAPTSPYNSGGFAGTSSSGGAGGSGGGTSGSPGGLGVGGAGGDQSGGGGGGGGLYGGGGGATYAGGGGGSSLGTVNGVTPDATSVSLTYSSVAVAVVAPAAPAAPASPTPSTPLALTGVDLTLPLIIGVSALLFGLLIISVTAWIRRRRSV